MLVPDKLLMKHINHTTLSDLVYLWPLNSEHQSETAILCAPTGGVYLLSSLTKLLHLSHYRGEAVTCCGQTAHTTTGDEQERAKGSADHCVELILPTAYHHQNTLSALNPHSCLKLRHRPEGSSCAGRLFSTMTWKHSTGVCDCLSSALQNGEHSRYFSMVCSSSICKANMGDWRGKSASRQCILGHAA